MRRLLKILALILFAPFILALLLILGVIAIVGIPLLWEQVVARFSAPPDENRSTL